MRRAGGRAVVADGKGLGAGCGAITRTATSASRAWTSSGRSDRRRMESPHIGPVRMRHRPVPKSSNAQSKIRQANEAAARDTEQVLATLTRNNATYTERDVERYLGKHIADDAERAAVKAKLFEHQDVAGPVRARERGA